MGAKRESHNCALSSLHSEDGWGLVENVNEVGIND